MSVELGRCWLLRAGFDRPSAGRRWWLLRAGSDGGARARLPIHPLPSHCAFPIPYQTPLPCRLEGRQREARSLTRQLDGLRAELGRLNALLAEAAGQRRELRESSLALESKLAGELKV